MKGPKIEDRLNCQKRDRKKMLSGEDGWKSENIGGKRRKWMVGPRRRRKKEKIYERAKYGIGRGEDEWEVDRMEGDEMDRRA